jgi:hypothetical protein
MNSKINPLKKAGYNYGNTLWGTGEGWGYFSPVSKSTFFEKVYMNSIFLVNYFWFGC